MMESSVSVIIDVDDKTTELLDAVHAEVTGIGRPEKGQHYLAGSEVKKWGQQGPGPAHSLLLKVTPPPPLNLEQLVPPGWVATAYRGPRRGEMYLNHGEPAKCISEKWDTYEALILRPVV